MQVSKDSNTMVSDMYPTDFLLKMDFVWNLVGEPFCNQKIRTDSNKTAIGNVSALEKKKKITGNCLAPKIELLCKIRNHSNTFAFPHPDVALKS